MIRNANVICRLCGYDFRSTLNAQNILVSNTLFIDSNYSLENTNFWKTRLFLKENRFSIHRNTRESRSLLNILNGTYHNNFEITIFISRKQFF